MKAIILAFIFIFSLSFASASVRINEVKPEGIEWIEVWNEDKITLNLNNWTIKDNSTDKPDTLSCKNIIDCSLITDTEFFLILGNATKIEDITKESIIYFYTDDTKIGNGLTDNGDIIILKENNSILNEMNYTKIKNNSMSLQFVDGKWCEGIPTPGKENTCGEDIDECIENWTCSEWSECADEIQERECEDNNNCGTTSSKPAIEQDCNETPMAEEKNCDNSSVIAITSLPSSAMFGSENEIEIKFNATCYGYDSIRFLVYGTGSRIVSDEQGNKITKYSGCENGTELQVSETVYDLKIPFFIYPNCDKYYKDGSYSVALRVCKPSWEKYSENIFSIEISGLNSSICTDETREFVFEENDAENDAKNENVSAEERLLNAPKLDENKTAETTAAADVVYESESEKIKNSAVYWLLGASVALSIYLIMVKIK